MKRQLPLFDATHLRLIKATKDAHDDYMKAQRLHRFQQYHRILWQACLHAQLKYEVRHGMVSSHKERRAA